MEDAQLVFSQGQVITANATSVASTNTVDLGAVTDHMRTALLAFGPENGEIRLVVTCGIQPTAGTALHFMLMDCDTVSGTYKPTNVGVVAANAIPRATILPGYELINVPLPRGLRRWLQITYTTTGDWTASVGTFDARLTVGKTTSNQAPYRA